ncbi:MAG: excinuclease ABC subunit UvrC [Bacteroidales bacterium]|nr:excinuclease ABC subunit UvrC [Bacteroidales bacterium]
MKQKENIDLILKSLPELPGVYQFFDKDDVLMYIGKAKNLKKRVSSYFVKNHAAAKTRIMVAKIENIRHIVVETETDALLLENNLVKKHQPKYNVMLKDDKTFPWICIKKEDFPRVFKTRNVYRDGSEYFGPYASGLMLNTLLDLIRKIFQLRTCKHTLSEENIKKKKIKTCLEYHIGNCKAPCAGYVNTEEYEQNINQIKNILKGNIQSVLQFLNQQMLEKAEKMLFEEAQEIKEKILLIEGYKAKSTIVNPAISNLDVFGYAEDEKIAVVNFIKVQNGAIIQAHSVELVKKLDEAKEDLLLFAILEIRERLFSTVKNVIVPFKPSLIPDNFTFIVPKQGDKMKLLELSLRNAKYYLLEKRKRQEIKNPETGIIRKLEVVRKDLRMTDLPRHIECFDNSNLQGTNPVAACVVFRNAKPYKSDYRHFNIKTVDGPDDFASMTEVVFRRYKRLIDENKSLPQLIIIDGGKGQLSAALNALETLGLRGKLTIIGIAKKLEEIYFPNDSIPVYLDKRSETLRLIQQLRNEAHRFGISFHRTKRKSKFAASLLTDIPGIGSSAAETLLKKYKSVERLKKCSLKELTEIVGKSKAGKIKTYFESEKPIS